MAGSLAALDAIRQVAGGRLNLEFRGAKAVRAFDSLVVVVAVRGQARGRRYDLLGCCATPEDEVAKGAVIATLDATNRVLERYAYASKPSPDPEGPGS